MTYELDLTDPITAATHGEETINIQCGHPDLVPDTITLILPRHHAESLVHDLEIALRELDDPEALTRHVVRVWEEDPAQRIFSCVKCGASVRGEYTRTFFRCCDAQHLVEVPKGTRLENQLTLDLDPNVLEESQHTDQEEAEPF